MKEYGVVNILISISFYIYIHMQMYTVHTGIKELFIWLIIRAKYYTNAIGKFIAVFANLENLVLICNI